MSCSVLRGEEGGRGREGGRERERKRKERYGGKGREAKREEWRERARGRWLCVCGGHIQSI